VTSLLRSIAAPALSGEVLPAARGRVTDQVPVPIVTRYGPGFGGSSLFGGRIEDGGDKEAQAGAMGANGTLYAITGGIAFDVSAVEWRLYKRAASGKAEDRTEVAPGSHPSQELFDQPNPFMTGQACWEVLQQHLELTGEGFPLIGFLGRIPMEIWPVYPHRMTPIPHHEDFLSGYVYSSPDGQRITLSTSECSMLRQPHPLTLFRGLSAVQAIAADLSAGMAASRWNDRFFTNSAIPGGVIEQDLEAGALTDDEFRTFVQRWREQHQGTGNAHRVAVLEAGMKWVPNQYSLKDLQFVELRGMNRDTVREAYRYPSAYLGTVEDANRANMEAQAVYYAEHLLKPRLTRWKAWRNRVIMRLFGPTDHRVYEWDFVDPTPPNSEADNAMWTAKSGAFVAFTQAGVDGKAAAKAMELPEVIADAWTKPEPPPVVAPGGPAGGKKAPPKKTNALAIAWAQTNEVDETPSDLDELQAEWAAATDETLARWQAEVSPQQRAAAEAAVVDAISAGDLAVLAALAVPVLGVPLLLESMIGMAGAGAASIVAEAAAAGAVVAAGAVTVAALQETAEATAGLLAAGLANAAGREALRLSSRGGDAASIGADVRAHLEALTDRALLDGIGAALTQAQNAGRLATLRAARYQSDGWTYELYADETLDRSTCKPCREIDGQVLPTLDAAQLAYGGAGYLWCEGRTRCRGTVSARWVREGGGDA
jgi:HK97 family phage portal protein